MTETDIEQLWERMGMIYGHRWTSGFGEADDGTWLTALSDLPPAALANGVAKCIKGGPHWPPTLPEFRDICLDIPSREQWIATAEERLTDWERGHMTHREITDRAKNTYESQAELMRGVATRAHLLLENEHG